METDSLPWLGAKSPTLVIQEFFDYDCPACRSSHKKLRRLMSDRSNEIRVVRHDMSRVECINEEGNGIRDRCVVARAAFCAASQNHFWDFNDAFIAAPNPESLFSRQEYAIALSKQLGLNVKELSDCLELSATYAHVQGIHEDGKKKGVKFTPAYFIDGRQMHFKDVVQYLKNH